MQEEHNPVKEYLFQYISKSQNIPRLISEEKFSDVIEEIIENCYEKIITLSEKSEALAFLATGILHYLLTNALINSQRKIEYQGLEVDIIIPDVKTLEKDPKKTLIMYIPKNTNKEIILNQLDKLEKIQPEKQNIWMVLSEKIESGHRSYIIGKQKDSFSKIIFDIAQFVNVNGENKFKILKI